MLRVDIREIRRGPVETIGTVPAADPLFAGLELALAGPLDIIGSLEITGRGDYVWHGRFSGRTKANCSRCLKELEVPVSAAVEAVFSADPDLQDDPSVYPLTEPVGEVDVTAAVREELAFAFSRFPLCRDDCAGLCPKCGADLNPGPCGCGGSK